jgi:hypothetical protein
MARMGFDFIFVFAASPAGFMDSIAGGGDLVTISALSVAGCLAVQPAVTLDDAAINSP